VRVATIGQKADFLKWKTGLQVSLEVMVLMRRDGEDGGSIANHLYLVSTVVTIRPGAKNGYICSLPLGAAVRAGK
jgi:hypothetical protein